MGENAYSAIMNRTRAEKLRVEAEELTNAEAKQTQLKIAADYENLADSIDINVCRK